MDKLAAFIFDFVIAVCIILVAGLIYFGLRAETVIETMDNEITDEFLSDIKESGSLTTVDYENFLRQLSLTNVLYDISFEHKYKIMEPEYRMRTIEEIIAAQKAAYKGENIYHYREVTTAKPNVTDPIDNSGLSMNTETNEGILAKAINTPATGHAHTDACYSGHKHTPMSSATFTHTHAHTNGCNRYIYKTGFRVHCYNCGSEYDFFCAFYKPNWELLWSDMYGLNNCIYCSAANPSKLYQLNCYTYTCGYDYDANGDLSCEEVPFGEVRSYPGKSAPQGPGTYTSGCWSYHKTKNIQDTISFYPYSGALNEKSVRDAFNEMWYTYEMQGYCDVPAIIDFGLSTNNSYANMTATSSPNIAYAEYKPFRDADGSIKFSLQYLFVEYAWGGMNWYGPSAHFPEVIDMATAKTFTSSSTLCNYLKADYNFDPWYSYGGSVTSHQRWYTETYTNICGFDHTKGVNQWVLNCGRVEDATLICNQKVISITPTNPNQSVFTNEPLITTVTATYPDGSKKVVLASTDFTTATPISKKTVKLTYTDTLGRVNTCTITVNVIPKTRVCGYGHTYNLNNDGSDPGCPFCMVYVLNIKVINPATTTMTITIGTTLQQNGLKLLVTYYDGHKEAITGSYEDNLDNQYLGTKPVTIGYKGATTQLMITVVCAKMTCDRCGFVYELYPDGTNPGCPKCISKTPVFTGKVLEYEEINYTNEILEELYDKGEYSFNTNDTFSVSVKSKTSTVARNFINLIFPSMNNRKWLLLKKSETIKAK